MGRLDDAAKHKVVELRKAGLSFRKIKAVLELDNIKVSAQAIYLFLREFQGRPPGRVKPLEAGRSAAQIQVHQPRTGPMQQSWNNAHLQNLLQKATFQAGKPEASAKPSGSSGSRPEQQQVCDKEENDIQIVSVTSLAQNCQQRSARSTITRAEMSATSSTPTTSGSFARKRVTASPATNSMLAARKRLLDKALTQKIKVAALLRRDAVTVQGADLRNTGPQQPSETYDLTTEKTVMEARPGGGHSAPRRFLPQRPGGVSLARSFPPLPRVGVRLPNRSPPSPLTSSSAPGVTVIRLQAPGSQVPIRSEGNPSPKQAVQDVAGERSGGGLQDQIQTLGLEVRGLGLAVKMLVEQQCRLEREQSQQTHIQKQILTTLQSFANILGRCSTSSTQQQQQHNKTTTPSSDLPTASASTFFSQNTFNFSQGNYAQSQPGYNSLEGLENVEAFKLPTMSPSSMNGFPQCSNAAESLPLTHTPPQTQAYTAAYQQQNSQALMPPYTQSSYVPTYSQPVMNSGSNSQEQQINIVKVEGL